jgi:hypothetical protein
MALSVPERMGLAVHHLQSGRFRDGWSLYEARWDLPDYPGNHLAIGGAPARSLADMTGRRVLLWHEQGLGETILMLRFIPAILRIASSVVVALPPGLKRLAAVLPGIEVISDGDAFAATDCHAPLMSLPFLLRTRVATIPAATPYLWPPTVLRQAWRDRLGPTSRLRVGLAWSDHSSRVPDARRSITLVTLAPLLHLPGIEFHALQDQLNEADRTALAESLQVRTYAGELTDFADCSALALNMDVVISVDTAVAHLSGALGLPLWVALPARAHWAWMIGRNDSPWYPTARLFRQTTADDWAPVTVRLRDALWQRQPSIIL